MAVSSVAIAIGTYLQNVLSLGRLEQRAGTAGKNRTLVAATAFQSESRRMDVGGTAIDICHYKPEINSYFSVTLILAIRVAYYTLQRLMGIVGCIFFGVSANKPRTVVNKLLLQMMSPVNSNI